MPNTYNAFKSCVSRLHEVLHLRRTKKTKPRLVISAPFDFKKEDSMCILPGISGEELYMLREKAAASIVGSALTSPYDAFSDSATLAPSSVHDLHLNRSTSSFDKASLHRHHNGGSHPHLPRSMTAPPQQTAPVHPCRRCKSSAAKETSSHHGLSGHNGHHGLAHGLAHSHSQRIGGGVSFYPPIVLASTEPYAPSGLSFPSSSSSASSISSRDRD